MNESTCIEIQELIERRFAGSSGRDDEARLAAHIAECADCAADLDLVERLESEAVLPEPSELDLARMRKDVMREIAQPRRNEYLRWAAAAAIAVVVFGGGFLLGTKRNASSAQQAVSVTPTIKGDAVASAIHTVAVRNTRIEDVENSPYLYSNVSVSEVDPATVSLKFDVSRHMELKLPKRDPLVAEVLVQSMLQPSGVGEKLSAISASEDLRDPKVRPALVKTMLTDENVAVRLKAQQKLVERAPKPDVDNAMLEVLKTDKSVQMRLVAIDYLTRRGVAPQLLRSAVEKGDQEGASVLYLRTSEYMKGRGQS